MEAGNICETASDYHEALAKISLYSYDCILLDITLPGGSGIEILKSLKQGNHTDGVLIIGNESKGISDALLPYITHPVTVPRMGGAESLNAAVAAGIILSRMSE